MEKKNILQPLPGTTERENRIIQECMRESQWCRGYAKAKGRRVKQMQVSREQVFAYVRRRGEEEVIIL